MADSETVAEALRATAMPLPKRFSAALSLSAATAHLLLMFSIYASFFRGFIAGYPFLRCHSPLPLPVIFTPGVRQQCGFHYFLRCQLRFLYFSLRIIAADAPFSLPGTVADF